MSTYQTQGIILKISDRGEADQLFSIYTKTHGKIQALGRGTKKIKSKLNCQLQPFANIDFMIASGKSYDHIAAATQVENFLNIKKDLKKIILASYTLELTEKMTENGMAEIQIFSLLKNFLKALNSEEFTDLKMKRFKQMFVIKLLSILGLLPPKNIINDQKKLDLFLKNNLEKELYTERFLEKIGY